MQTKMILAIATGFSLFACNDSTPITEKIVVEQETVIEEDNHSHNEDVIVLDNGKKWIVAPSMMAFIQTMEKGVEDFSTKENPTSENYQELAILIDKNIRALTSNCTMEGQAHDELHKWLVPFIELSEQFDVATELDKQQQIYQEFQQAYKTFNIYFE